MLNEDQEKVTIEFAVSDTGIGIPENKIESIFDNFQQATSGTSRLYGGTGLGLAIVKQLVEPQGGSISVKSKIEEGSTFSFTLKPGVPGPGHTSGPPSPAAGRRPSAHRSSRLLQPGFIPYYSRPVSDPAGSGNATGGQDARTAGHTQKTAGRCRPARSAAPDAG